MRKDVFSMVGDLAANKSFIDAPSNSSHQVDNDVQPDYPPYTTSTHPVSQLIVHPAPASRKRVESESEELLAKQQFVGMKRVLCEMWVLLGRRSEITCSLIHVDGLFRARRINEYVWLVRKLRLAALSSMPEPKDSCSPIQYEAHYSPYYMIIPDDLVVERDDPPNLTCRDHIDRQQNV